MLEGGFDHGLDVVLREAGLQLGVDAAAVDAHADREVVIAGHRHQPGDLLADRLVLLVVPEVPRVVPDLVDVGGDLLGEAVALLEVDDEVGRRLATDLGEGGDVARAVDGDAHEDAAGLAYGLRLLDGGVNVLGTGRAHALHGHGMAGPESDGADADLSGRVS